MQTLLETIAALMVRLAIRISLKGWRMATLNELIKQAEEAREAQVAVADADVAVTNAILAVEDAKDHLQKANQTLIDRQADAITQLSEANEALLAYVKGQTPEPIQTDL